MKKNNRFHVACKHFHLCLLSLFILLSGCTKPQGGNSTEPAETDTTAITTEESINVENENDSYDQILAVATAEDPEDILTFAPKDLQELDDVALEDEYAKRTYVGMNDDNLRQNIQDCIYEELESRFDESEVTIENVQSLYFSKEYLEEYAYNSRTNIFFGYSLEDIKKQFGDNKYVFTLGENGNTVVKEFSPRDNIYDDVIKNTLIGSGVILVCVTLAGVSTAASASLGVSRMQIILSFSAAGALIGGTVVGAASAVAAGVTEYLKNGDSHDATEAAFLAGSRGFKWGAIGGAVAGAAIGTYVTSGIHTPRESELFVQKLFPGSTEQAIFKDGMQITKKVSGSTIPDLIKKTKDGRLIAVEVKNYDMSIEGLRSLVYKLKLQMSNRVANMPEGTIQRLVLDVTGRGYDKKALKFIVNTLQNSLKDVCPNLIISVVGF